MATNDENRRAKIAELNDQVRKGAGLPTSHFQATNPHRVLITAGIAASGRFSPSAAIRTAS